MTIMDTTVVEPTDLPVVDSPLDPEVAEPLADDILLSAVRDTKPARVTARSRNGSRLRGVATSPRAWTMGGSVD